MDDEQGTTAAQVWSRFHGTLEQIASGLRQRFPNASVGVYWLPGDYTLAEKRFSIGIVVELDQRLPDDTNSVCLEIQLEDVDAAKRVDAAVGWGYPSGYTEAAFVSDPREPTSWPYPEVWPAASPEVLDAIADDMPRLAAALEQAVKRGAPPGR